MSIKKQRGKALNGIVCNYELRKEMRVTSPCGGVQTPGVHYVERYVDLTARVERYGYGHNIEMVISVGLLAATSVLYAISGSFCAKPCNRENSSKLVESQKGCSRCLCCCVDNYVLF